MPLKGDFTDFNIDDVIQFLTTAEKTGILKVGVEGVKRGGEIFFNEGLVVHAKVDKLIGEEAFYKVLTQATGEFYFEEKKIKDHTIQTPTYDLIINASRRFENWNSIKDQYPTFDVTIKLAPDPPEESANIELTAEEWRVMTHIDGKNTIEMIAQKAKMPETNVCSILHTLSNIGLVEKESVSGRTLQRIGALLCERVMEQYRRLRGPMIANQLESDFNDWLKSSELQMYFADGKFYDESGEFVLENIAESYKEILNALVTILKNKIGHRLLSNVWRKTIKNTSEMELELIERFEFDHIFEE